MENSNQTPLSERKRVLITVVTYPLPSRSYDELVCTAGILEDSSWIRIYPVPLQFLKGLRADGKIKSYKYTWIELNLKKRTDDFRPESHSPENYNFSNLKVLEKIDTKNNWRRRKNYCLKNIYTSMEQLIKDSGYPCNISLATFNPTEIIDFIVEEDERDWKPEWKQQLNQLQINFGDDTNINQRESILKVPYKFFYRFKDENGRISKLMIEDWELGALYWNCLKNSKNAKEALEKVRNRYYDDFVFNKKIYLFLGTTKEWHIRRVKNPFVIIGVFYPPKEETEQMELF